MLRTIPGWKFREWKQFNKLEPFPDKRADLNAAHIVQFLWALSGDKRYPNGRPLSDFVLSFGDMPPTEPVRQSVEYQEMVIDGWVLTNNATAKAKGVQ